jgi:alkylation response protein AidB-like acyl-CoA dehydrogenase
MDFRLSDETLEWKEYRRRFAREVIRPVAPKHDREESVPYEVMNEAYAWNLAGIDWIMSLQNDPEGLKGVIYAEELHWGCAGIALAISASTLCAAGIASSGTPDQIARWIPEVVGSKDRPRIGAYAVTEPQAGSDVKSLRTTARRDGDDWILNGTKTFISNGGIADVTVVVATVDPELGHRGQASFIVTKDNPGLTAASPAMHCSAAMRSWSASSSAPAPASAPSPRAPLRRSRSRGRRSARRRWESPRLHMSGRSSTWWSARTTAARSSRSSASSR